MSKKKPKISLIIPLYNGAEYLSACLSSVAAQSFKDFEAILVDDGSKDNSLDIATSYMAKCKQLKLISQENGGVSAARNYGLEQAEGAYIAFLDQDDALHPDALKALDYMIETFQTDIASIGVKKVSNSFVMENPQSLDMPDLKLRFIDSPLADFLNARKRTPVWIWNKLYKKEILNGIRFPEGVQPAEDTVFTIKVLSVAKSQIASTDELLYYRISDISVMKQGVTKKYIRSHFLAAQEMYKHLMESNLKPEWRAKVRKYIAYFAFKSLVSLPLRRLKKEDDELLDYARKAAQKLFEDKVLNLKYLTFAKAGAVKLFLKSKDAWAKFFL